MKYARSTGSQQARTAVAALLCSSLVTWPWWAEAAIVGTYENKIETVSSSTTITLRCESEARCEMEASSVAAGRPPSSSPVTPFTGTPVSNLDELRRALKYARDRKTVPTRNEQWTAIREALKPLLDSSADLSRCIKLASGANACELSSSPWNKPVVIYFGVDLANCREDSIFCVYVLFPLFQTATTALMRAPVAVAQVPARSLKRPERPSRVDIETTPPSKWRLARVGWIPDNELAAASEETKRGIRLFREYGFWDAYVVLLPEAEKGDTVAQVAIGSTYVHGLGHARSLEKALYWLKQADAKGSRWAAETIGRIYDDGILVPRDVEEAKKWYLKAGQTSSSNTGRLYYIWGYPKNYVFLTDPPNTRWSGEPDTWVADAERQAFSFELYDKLDAYIKLPEWFKKHASQPVDVVLAPDGTVVSVDVPSGPAVGRSVSTDAADQKAISESLKAGVAAIVDGIKAASPLPRPPSWVPASTKIKVSYPPRFLNPPPR